MDDFYGTLRKITWTQRDRIDGGEVYSGNLQDVDAELRLTARYSMGFLTKKVSLVFDYHGTKKLWYSMSDFGSDAQFHEMMRWVFDEVERHNDDLQDNARLQIQEMLR